MGIFDRIRPPWMGGNPPAPPAHKEEGELPCAERLAIYLACGHLVGDYMPRNRVELLDAWKERSESVRVGYRRRAKRLIEAWGEEDGT